MNMPLLPAIAIALNSNSTDDTAFVVGLLIKLKIFMRLALLGK